MDDPLERADQTNWRLKELAAMAQEFDAAPLVQFYTGNDEASLVKGIAAMESWVDERAARYPDNRAVQNLAAQKKRNLRCRFTAEGV